LRIEVKKYLRQNYLDTDSWNLDAIERASKDVGSLARWLTAQLDFREILSNVEPWQREVDEK
jgi:hypothetical protein